MRSIFISFATIFISLQMGAVENVTISYADLKTLVESRNERVLSKDHEVKAAEVRQGALVRSFLPDIEIYGAQERFKKGTAEQKAQPFYGIEAKVNIFNGGRDSLLNKKTKIASERLRIEKQATIAEQVSHARELFWEALFLEQQTIILNEAQQINKKNLQSANRRIGSGVATRSDRIEFEMKETELKQDLAKSELQLNNKLRSLAVILGYAGETQLALNQSYKHEHDWESGLQHLRDANEILTKPAKLKAEELEIDAASSSRAYWPQVDAYAGWAQHNEREEDFADAEQRKESVVGVRMTIPIGAAVKGRNEGQAQRMEAQALQLQSKYLQREIDTHLHSELAELKFLHDQVHDAEVNIKKAESYYSLTQSEYSRGVKNSPDVLGASERFFNFKLKHLEIIKDFQISKSHLLSKLGK